MSKNRDFSQHPQGIRVEGSNTGILIDSYGIQANNLGEVTGARTIDMRGGNYILANANGNITWTFSIPPNNANAYGFILQLRYGGDRTITWPSPNTKWPSGTAPTLTVGGNDVISFVTVDGGLTWRGVASMLDSR